MATPDPRIVAAGDQLAAALRDVVITSLAKGLAKALLEAGRPGPWQVNEDGSVGSIEGDEP